MNHYDLAIIGSGSGNSIVNEKFADMRVALLEEGTFGGTCLNVGCIPTKMFVYPADLAHAAAHAERLGVDTHLDKVHWPQIRDRIFRRIDPISVAGRNWRAERNDNLTLYEGHARFIGSSQLDTGTGETITAEQIVIAAGSRVVVPPIPGLGPVATTTTSSDGSAQRPTRVHTSDTVMRVEQVPDRLAIIGGGFVAAEFAHIFGAFGSEVTILNRSGVLLREEDREISARFAEVACSRWDVRLDTVATRVEEYDGGLRLHLSTNGEKSTLEVDTVLLATGRRSNSDGLDVSRAGVQVDEAGRILVDEFQRTNVKGIWALGDVSNSYQLKHVSNHEARVVQHNLLHPDDPVKANHAHVPSAVFTYPQIASVGLTEQEAQKRDLRYVTARQSYGDTAYGWAMEDTTSFAKVLADPETGTLLGAHLIGPQASNLIQPLIQAMSFGHTAHEVARGQYWIHPALSEVVENVLLGLDTAEPSTSTPG
ncbi:MAG: mycothione reductase [Actinomycetota bacterium]|nr:mycothione reductase [Actinomycetota bacterium]